MLQHLAILVLLVLLNGAFFECDVGELGLVPGLVDFSVARSWLAHSLSAWATLQIVSLAVEQLE